MTQRQITLKYKFRQVVFVCLQETYVPVAHPYTGSLTIKMTPSYCKRYSCTFVYKNLMYSLLDLQVNTVFKRFTFSHHKQRNLCLLSSLFFKSTILFFTVE